MLPARLIAMALFALVPLAAAPAHAQTAPPPAAAQAVEPPRHSAEEVAAFVNEAVEFMKKVGPEKAFAAFNNPKGKWIDGDLYIFVFDMKGVYKATGYRPERTGTDAWKMTDAAGQLVVQEIVKRAKRHGTSTVDYLWKNPLTGKLENKTSYVVHSGDYVVGAGYYHK
ncbi:cache domain-containing protein [Magnetospirillum sp. UT-4]|uniref:cache domain-containing protein n=1 Tax=Magnetospirillum sp. UT-4 TaxID=2681467 RepID=UPI00137E64DB|nr:cache domain-containing protein [Magnetospirillum sp. UT-4]CAA7613429.1 conserved exported hypothetical protein [Magnetospirillum sp. UT-4]